MRHSRAEDDHNILVIHLSSANLSMLLIAILHINQMVDWSHSHDRSPPSLSTTCSLHQSLNMNELAEFLLPEARSQMSQQQYVSTVCIRVSLHVSFVFSARFLFLMLLEKTKQVCPMKIQIVLK